MAEIFVNSEGWLRAVMVLGWFVTPTVLVAMVLAYLLAARRIAMLSPELERKIREVAEAQCRLALGQEARPRRGGEEREQARLLREKG